MVKAVESHLTHLLEFILHNVPPSPPEGRLLCRCSTLRSPTALALHTVTCWICNKEVPISECKFDEHNHPVHEECSVARLSLRNGNDEGRVGRVPSLLEED